MFNRYNEFMTQLISTRADVVVNFCYLVTVAAPIVCFWSVRLVRKKEFQKHCRVQTILLSVCVLAVLLLEGRIRMAGGAGALVAGSRYADTSVFRTVAAIHIGGAVLTYIAWIWLVVVSRRAFGRTLPGSFSPTHKRFGWAVITGLCFTTVSATFVYYMGFVE